MTAAAAAGAAAAAAARARQEEEEMTPYSSQDLAQEWEFKILRSTTSRFRNPVVLHAILAEEARAGWTLLEKFDDTRIRLKRPARARAGDAALDFDPHRTWVGISPTQFAILVVTATLVGIGIVMALIFAILYALGVH